MRKEEIKEIEMATGKWWVKEAQNRIMAIQNIKLAVAFVGLNILDAGLTVATANRGIVCEVNPFMRYFLEQPWIFGYVKIFETLVCTLILLLLSAKYPRQVKRIFIILIAVMLGICLVNLVALI